ncbi:phage integrase family domain protein [Mycobacterium xenopi 4042]|uniref:Phage integrase family domain protein n=1 Tax=Mycobacterium xenopi 4042 TaxID=1299334 RepID=X7Z951_MYCXE|nr:phage integrase family domain protein [Mycobacterium xenopi 4042]
MVTDQARHEHCNLPPPASARTPLDHGRHAEDHPYIKHVTPQMTLRYATLASPTLRAAYDEAMGKMRRQFTLTPVGKPILPDKVGWLHSEMLKTRVAHGYCARHPAAGTCPYANICETCDNYVTAPEFRDALTSQLADIQALKADAATRGWTDEVARHDRVATPSPTTSNALNAESRFATS